MVISLMLVKTLNNIAPQALILLNISELKLAAIEKFADFAAVITLNEAQLIHSFSFNKEKGYVLYLENIYQENQEKFMLLLQQQLAIGINDECYSNEARKTKVMINLLLSSQDPNLQSLTAELFLKHTSSLAQTTKNQHLIFAAQCGFSSLMDNLIQANADIKALDQRLGHLGLNALHHAAYYDHPEIVKKILEKAPEVVSFQDHDGKTALDIAVSRGHTQIVKLLLEKAPELVSLKKDRNGQTAFHWAAAAGKIEIVKQILEKTPEVVSFKDNDGNTALHCAAAAGEIEIVKKILEKAPEVVSFEDSDGNTALRMAFVHGKIEIIKEILEMVPEVFSFQDVHGRTILHDAAGLDLSEIVKQILEKTPDIASCKDVFGYTAMHLADNPEMVKIFLAYGVIGAPIDKNVKNL